MSVDHDQSTGAAPRATGYDMLPILELADVLTNGCPADARVTLDIHVVAQCEHNRLDLGREFAGGEEDERPGLADGDVDRLQNTDRISRWTG
jgi:hypothetical protein